MTASEFIPELSRTRIPRDTIYVYDIKLNETTLNFPKPIETSTPEMFHFPIPKSMQLHSKFLRKPNRMHLPMYLSRSHDFNHHLHTVYPATNHGQIDSSNVNLKCP